MSLKKVLTLIFAIGFSCTVAAADDFKVLTIDWNDDGTVNQESVINRSDGILMLKTSPQTTLPTDEPSLHGVFNYKTLISILDSNHDGRSDAYDPLFSSLMMVTFTQNGNSYKLMPASDAGIRAIFFPTNESKEQITNQGPGFTAVAGYVVLADSSKRPLVIIPFDKKLLDKVR